MDLEQPPTVRNYEYNNANQLVREWGNGGPVQPSRRTTHTLSRVGQDHAGQLLSGRGGQYQPLDPIDAIGNRKAAEGGIAASSAPFLSRLDAPNVPLSGPRCPRRDCKLKALRAETKNAAPRQALSASPARRKTGVFQRNRILRRDPVSFGHLGDSHKRRQP